MQRIKQIHIDLLKKQSIMLTKILKIDLFPFFIIGNKYIQPIFPINVNQIIFLS